MLTKIRFCSLSAYSCESVRMSLLSPVVGTLPLIKIHLPYKRAYFIDSCSSIATYSWKLSSFTLKISSFPCPQSSSTIKSKYPWSRTASTTSSCSITSLQSFIMNLHEDSTTCLVSISTRRVSLSISACENMPFPPSCSTTYRMISVSIKLIAN